jgi:hypothetical protein
MFSSYELEYGCFLESEWNERREEYLKSIDTVIDSASTQRTT